MPNQLVMNTPTKISPHLIQAQADSLAWWPAVVGRLEIAPSMEPWQPSSPGITAAVTSQCAAAYYSCSSTCSQATAASASQPAFVTAIAAYKSRCEVFRKTNSFTSSVQGVGNSVRAAYDCQKQLANNNDCMKDPIKCIFGNSDCSTPQSRQSNPACFANTQPQRSHVRYREQNAGPQLLIRPCFHHKPFLQTQRRYACGATLTSSALFGWRTPNPAEALLANSKPQPVGTVELQGKSGDGLSGASGGGSALGSAQNQDPLGKQDPISTQKSIQAFFLLQALEFLLS